MADPRECSDCGALVAAHMVNRHRDLHDEVDRLKRKVRRLEAKVGR